VVVVVVEDEKKKKRRKEGSGDVKRLAHQTNSLVVYVCVG
jgi:hypothetical protein